MRRITWGGRAAATILFTTTLVVATPATPFGAARPASAAAVPAITAAQLADPAFMEAFYRDHLLAAIPSPGPTGDVTTCDPGTTTAAYRTAEVDRLNAYRAIAGVPSAVVESATRSAAAQSALLVRWAKGNSDVPVPGDPCYDPTSVATLLAGAAATYFGPSSPTAPRTGVDLIVQTGFGRDAMLWPSLGEVGIGTFTHPGPWLDQGEELVDTAGPPNSTTPRPTVRDPNALVAWPPCGSALPYPLAAGVWSISRPGLVTDGSSLAVTKNGAPFQATWYRHRTEAPVEESSLLYYGYETVLPPVGGTDHYEISISGAMQDGAPATLSCSFDLFDINVAPSTIGVHPSIVEPDAGLGAVVGDLFNHDFLPGAVPNGVGSSYAYELVSGDGDGDNAQFTIVGGQLRTSASFVGTEGTRTIRVRVTENRPHGVFEQAVTVTVARQPAQLEPLAARVVSVDENLPPGTVIATYPPTDARGFPISYSVDPASEHAAWFTFVGGELRTTISLDYEARRSASVAVRATNGRSNVSGTVLVVIRDVREGPPGHFALIGSSSLPGEAELTWWPPYSGAEPTHYVISWPGGSATVDGGTLSYVVRGLPADTVTITVTAVNSSGTSTATEQVAIPRAAAWPSAFHPLAPARLLDTRPGAAIGHTGPKPGPGGVIEVQIVGAFGVPDDAVAVALNVTATDASAAGYVSAYPAGTAPPNVSSVNVEAGSTAANSVIVPIGAGGKVALYTEKGTHLIADIAGYWTFAEDRFSRGGRVVPVEPARLLDTRAGPRPTADSVVNLPVVGRAQVPPSRVAAVILNVTATDPAGAGFVTVWPSSSARPNASNVNISRGGQTIANQVIVPVGPDGAIQLYTEAGTHLIVDVTAYITDDTADPAGHGLFVPVEPFRQLDTRLAAEKLPADHYVTAIDGGDVAQAVDITTISGWALNVTATESDGAGFVAAFPCLRYEGTSTLNLDGPGQTVPNAATVAGLPACVGTSVTTHVIVDVFGYYTR